MKITDIISLTERPAIYEKGTAFMWTDKHISRQLLDIHLNPDLDLASRKQSSIKKNSRMDPEHPAGEWKTEYP